jgi:hypothetical protein
VQAETETDEMFAQITLQPEPDVSLPSLSLFLQPEPFGFSEFWVIFCLNNSVHMQFSDQKNCDLVFFAASESAHIT